MKITESHSKGSPSTLGERIRIARSFAKLSQASLGKACSVTASAVAQWENPAGTRPGLDHLLAVAAATGVLLEWLISGKAPMTATEATLRGEAPVETLAVTPDIYAMSSIEEELLENFRKLPLRAREYLIGLMREFLAHRSGRSKQRR